MNHRINPLLAALIFTIAPIAHLTGCNGPPPEKPAEAPATSDAGSPPPPELPEPPPPPPPQTVWTCEDLEVTDGTKNGGCVVASRALGQRRIETIMARLGRIKTQKAMDALNASLLPSIRAWIRTRYGFRLAKLDVMGGKDGAAIIEKMDAKQMTAFLSTGASRSDAGWEPGAPSTEYDDSALISRIRGVEEKFQERSVGAGAPSGAIPEPCPPPGSDGISGWLPPLPAPTSAASNAK